MANETDDRGVIYYNKGAKCRVRLLASLYSLRCHYGGPVSVLHEGRPARWFRREVERMGAKIKTIAVDTDISALTRKASLWRDTPYSTTLFLDADTIVRASIEPLFAAIEERGFMTYNFADWVTTGPKISKRIRAWEPVIGAEGVAKAMAYGKAVNTGIHGYVRDSPMLVPWENATRDGFAQNCTRIMVDELACQVLLPEHPHTLVGPEWGRSPAHAYQSKGTKILHFHGDKHVQVDNPACDIWRAVYWEYRNTSPEYTRLGQPGGDRRLRRYLNGGTDGETEIPPSARKDITIVTAVNAGYMERFRHNWERWRLLPGIREQQFLVFWHGERPDWLDEHRNVRQVEWDFPAAGDNVRERMLSCFIFGTAEHVKTAYWLKLDADARSTGKAFEWPPYTGYAICGHKCGRTVTKGQDPPQPGHFLNQLDEWWHGEAACKLMPERARLAAQYDHAVTVERDDFPEIPERKHSHQRVASYCWTEETALTRAIAAACGDRLPIPSHDTLTWYVAWRLGLPILRRNMREWFKA